MVYRGKKSCIFKPMIDDELRKKIATYQPGEETIAILRTTPIALVVGISGAGKDTIVSRLLQTNEYRAVVSHTTRPMRENSGIKEQNGVEYYFITIEEAAELIAKKAYIEVKIYNDNIYGTTIDEVLKVHNEGKIALNDVEVQGVAEFVALTPTVRPIFILPPSFEAWQQRLLSRYGDDQQHNEDIVRRMQIAESELRFVQQAEYFSLVINDDLNTAIEEVDVLAHTETSTPKRAPEAFALIQTLLDRLAAVLPTKAPPN